MSIDYREDGNIKDGAFYECPKCKSDEIYGGNWDCDGDTVWQKVTCDNCDFQWNEAYYFFRAETCDTCEPIDENGNVI